VKEAQTGCFVFDDKTIRRLEKEHKENKDAKVKGNPPSKNLKAME
jgi:hypothetical protein